MLYLLYVDPWKQNNSFLSKYEYYPQIDELTKMYYETIKSENPYKERSLKENWKVVETELYKKYKLNKIRDFTKLTPDQLPVFSEKAMDILGEFLNENGEFLPFYCIDYDKTYYIYHVQTFIDIIDEKIDENGKIISKWNFNKDPDFENRSIFKIISHLKSVSFSSEIVITQKFLDKVEKYKLKGFDKFLLNRKYNF